jgi:hypothetical protein
LFLPWFRVALLENVFASLGVVDRESWACCGVRKTI